MSVKNRFGVTDTTPETKPEPVKKETKSNDDMFGEYLVLYTDGGSRPTSRGFAGSGIHGYFHTLEPPKQGSGAKQVPTMYGYDTKEPTEPEVDETGAEIVPEIAKTPVTVKSYFDAWYSFKETQTNNYAEVYAATKALEIAIGSNVKRLIIFTDSKYTINGITTWIKGWKERNWRNKKGEPVENKNLWIEFDNMVELFRSKGGEFIIDHVRGHSGNLGNDMADDHATRGVILSSKGTLKAYTKLSPAKGYWSPKVDLNPFLSKSCWYFSTNVDEHAFTSFDGRYVYMMGNHGPEDRFLGKRVSDSSFSIAYLKNPEPVLEEIHKYQESLSDASSVVVGRYDYIREPSRYRSIFEHGTEYLTVSPKSAKNDLTLPNGVIITREQKPAMLSFRALETLNGLDAIFERFLKGECGDLAIDITDKFFTTTEAAKGKLKTIVTPDIRQDSKYIEIEIPVGVKGDVKMVKTKMLFDMDLPSRNFLSKVAESNVKISAVSWLESDRFYRFATIVETEDDAAIWSTVYSNMKMVP